MLASSNVSMGVFAQTFLKPESAGQNLRRNFLVLFDQMQNESVKIDVSLGVCLVDR